MITAIRRLVYFGSLFLAIMTIVLIMIHDDMGYVPHDVQVGMLTLIFILGALLAFLMIKRGMGG